MDRRRGREEALTRVASACSKRDSLGANRHCSCNERSANLKKARKLSVTSSLQLFFVSSFAGNKSAFERHTRAQSAEELLLQKTGGIKPQADDEVGNARKWISSGNCHSTGLTRARAARSQSRSLVPSGNMPASSCRPTLSERTK